MSRRKNSEFVKAFGTAFEIWKLIVDAVFARGGDDSHLRLLLKKPELVGQLADLIVNAGRKVAEPVVPLFAQLIAACKQDWVDPDVSVAHFPLVDDGTKGPIEEYCFNREMESVDVETELKKLGFKIVGMKRGLEYVATHPGSQLHHPVVVFGAWWRNSLGRVHVPVFYLSSGERKLVLHNWFGNTGGRLRSYCRFMVSRE